MLIQYVKTSFFISYAEVTFSRLCKCTPGIHFLRNTNLLWRSICALMRFALCDPHQPVPVIKGSDQQALLCIGGGGDGGGGSHCINCSKYDALLPHSLSKNINILLAESQLSLHCSTLRKDEVLCVLNYSNNSAAAFSN